MKTRLPAQLANSEWLTRRKRRIDSMLKAADWKVAPFASGTLTSQNNRGIEVGDLGLNLVGSYLV
jgi:hypothetical protein